MEGIERISKMIEGQKDKYLKIIVNHLLQHNELDQAFMNKEKNLKDMASYIKDKARKKATNGVAVIEDEIVFGWAIEYFVKSNDELKIKKNEIKKTETINTQKGNLNDEFGSIFDSSDNQIIEKKEVEQISLF